MFSQRRLYQLLVLNVVLQLFDALATYQGLRIGAQEGNPLLDAAFASFGVGPGLLMFKSYACGSLLWLHRYGSRTVAAPGLMLVAAINVALSLVPWTTKFLLEIGSV